MVRRSPPADDAPPPRPPARAAPTLATLQKRLRAHVGRQIARLDAALEDEAAGIDSARVLRDLVGLKKLLDELSAETRGGGGADGERRLSSSDLAGMREAIARRYEACEREWPAGAVPVGPAGGSASPPRN